MTLGQSILGSTITIPFLNVVLALLVFVGPMLIGAGITKWKPQTKYFMQKIIKPFTLSSITAILCVGAYANFYIFRYFAQWRLPVSGVTLTYIGLLIGMVVAAIFRQGRHRIVTIGVETAIQNVIIALIVLKLSLPQPEADIASILPIVAFLLTPIPLFTALFVLVIKKAWAGHLGKRKLPESSIAEVEIIVTKDQDLKTTVWGAMMGTNRTALSLYSLIRKTSAPNVPGHFIGSYDRCMIAPLLWYSYTWSYREYWIENWLWYGCDEESCPGTSTRLSSEKLLLNLILHTMVLIFHN